MRNRDALTREIEGLIEESNVDLINENANKDGKSNPQLSVTCWRVSWLNTMQKLTFCHVTSYMLTSVVTFTTTI
ncbi:hypothetical protein OH492_28215 [Vibrio chagasii]|nr:hypothetical protein [Vibrio chagasii]